MEFNQHWGESVNGDDCSKYCEQYHNHTYFRCYTDQTSFTNAPSIDEVFRITERFRSVVCTGEFQLNTLCEFNTLHLLSVIWKRLK